MIGGCNKDSYPDSIEVAIASSDPDIFWLSGHDDGRDERI